MNKQFKLVFFFLAVSIVPVLCQASVTILSNTSPNHTITSGSNEKIYGTSASNQIILEGGAKTELINFPGQNSIQIQSSSELFTVSRSGTIVTLEGSDGTILMIPATHSVQTIDFSDRTSMTLSIHNNQVMLDDQVVTTTAATLAGGSETPGGCGAYVAPGVWKEFDCYNLAAIGKTTNDDPFTPSWRLIGGYWQWGRKGPDPSQWYDTNTEHFAHGPTGPGENEANSGEISGWDNEYADEDAWSDSYKASNDPCPAGFRVTTRTQWEGILENNTQRIAGTWDSYNTNYSSGQFFGSKLFLPAAGYRDSTSGILHNRGSDGYYWSSFRFSSYNDAWNLYFNSGFVGKGIFGHLRDGRSVRCTADDPSDGFYAGIVEIAIGNENNVISSFPGKSIESGIQIVSDDPDNQFSFEIMEGPSGMVVDSDGVVTYTIPESSETGVSVPFKVNILNTASNESVMLEGSIYVMTAVEIGSGIVTSEGGSVSDQTGDIVVEVPAGSVSQDVEIKIIQSRDVSGNEVIDLSIDGNIDGTFELYLPDPSSMDSDDFSESLPHSETHSLQSSTQYPLNYSWINSSKRYFTVVGQRLPNKYTQGFRKYVLTMASWTTISPIVKMNAYVLESTQPKPTSGTTLSGDPVLFVHGYLPSFWGFGGGEGTWGNFPLLIRNLNNGAYIPFEFRWRTNARFQDVADDLGECLSLIVSRTDKKVHIVAHSFGGVLTRTLLQILNGDGYDYTRHVASVTTLGTPHSGIFDKEETAHGVKFPKGQDSRTHSLGAQISTHQMGEANFIGTPLLPLLGVAIEKGEFAAELANNVDTIPPGIPIQVGIGLTTDRDDPFIIDEGDKLITYEGQRFHPDLTIYGRMPLLENSTEYGGRITEFLLGFGDRDAGPGDDSYFIEGYRHTRGDDAKPSEAKVTCSDNETCQHASYIAVRDWLKTHGQGGDEPIHGDCGAYVALGVWKEFDCYNLAAIGKTTGDDPFTPSWRLIGGYWQWGRKGPDESQWYSTDTEHFAHGPTGPGSSEANDDSISNWDDDFAPAGSWSDSDKTAKDPCPEGYRLPTESQWEGVYANNTQSKVGTWDSDDTNYSSTRFFGSDLMLPAAGSRYWGYSWALSGRGGYGFYWSSLEHGSNSAWSLVFSSDYTGTGSYSRRNGHSVRCVSE
jgi:uncharacterized protein (TIGR02145 family)